MIAGQSNCFHIATCDTAAAIQYVAAPQPGIPPTIRSKPAWHICTCSPLLQLFNRKSLPRRSKPLMATLPFSSAPNFTAHHGSEAFQRCTCPLLAHCLPSFSLPFLSILSPSPTQVLHRLHQALPRPRSSPALLLSFSFYPFLPSFPFCLPSLLPLTCPGPPLSAPGSPSPRRRAPGTAPCRG